MKFHTLVNNINMEGTVSQIFDIGPSFIFMSKNGNIYFLHFIKQKLVPISKI